MRENALEKEWTFANPQSLEIVVIFCVSLDKSIRFARCIFIFSTNFANLSPCVFKQYLSKKFESVIVDNAIFRIYNYLKNGFGGFYVSNRAFHLRKNYK